MTRLIQIIRREIRLSPIWLSTSLAWSLGALALFLLVYLGAEHG